MLLPLPVLAILAFGAALLTFSGASLADDPAALARVDVDAFGGTLVSATATRAGGQPLPLNVAGGRLTPTTQLTPGETVTVDAVVRRPGAFAWLIGKSKHVRLTVKAPVATLRQDYVTRAADGTIPLRFDRDVELARAGGKRVDGSSLTETAAAGRVRIRAKARPWETLGKPITLHWFPQSADPVALAHPAAGEPLSPAQPIRLTFSKPVKDVLGDQRPTLTPDAPGTWKTKGDHQLVFKPSGYGVGFDTDVKVQFPKAVALADGDTVRTTSELDYHVPAGSTERLNELLAEAGYLPVAFKEDTPVATTKRAQVKAAVEPPAGHFHWRYDNTPAELTSQWDPKQNTAITRGAVMMFQSDHHLDVDAVAGPTVWHELIAATLAGTAHHPGYSYVYVHRNVPQLLTLWHNGHTVLTSPGNTGIPQAPTDLGTFPVFEHVPVTTMSGTNPDGSTYNDPGIKWVSYFNGGDALHTFNRASFGTPQSLGCVELPESAAARLYPYTPIGTLVTIED
jgi:lipoprotein-anchoring transpeptidase ErfK/SrfK